MIFRSINSGGFRSRVFIGRCMGYGARPQSLTYSITLGWAHWRKDTVEAHQGGGIPECVRCSIYPGTNHTSRLPRLLISIVRTTLTVLKKSTGESKTEHLTLWKFWMSTRKNDSCCDAVKGNK